MKIKFILFLDILIFILVSCDLNTQGLLGNNDSENGKLIKIICNGKSVEARLSKNKSADEFYSLLKRKDITLNMSDYCKFEKKANLPNNLTISKSDTNFTATSGDIILSQGKTIEIYYSSHSGNFTKLGHIVRATQAKMNQFLNNNGNVRVTFSTTTTLPKAF